MLTDSVPTYDYSFLKKLNETFYTDFDDLIKAYLTNIQAPIFQIANGLFEKGFKYILEKEGKVDLFFEEDPNLTQMVLSSKYPESRAYLRSRIQIDYDVVFYVRDSANIKKHALSEVNPVLNKAVIITELFSLFVQIHNLYYSFAVEIPSKEYIEYVSSFSEYRDHKLEDIDIEIQKRLEKAESEVKSRLKSAEEKLAEKQNQIIAANSKLNEVQSEIQRSGSLLDEANAKISTAENLLKEKAQEVKGLDDYLTKRKAEIVLTESSQADNDLYELANSFLNSGDFDSALRVFKNIQNSNIRDLRAFFGIILCLFKAKDINELISNAVQSKRQLKSESIFDDIKFLKENDKQFIIEISDKIDVETLYLQAVELIEGHSFDTAQTILQELKVRHVDSYVAELGYKLQNRQILSRVVALLRKNDFDNAIELLASISSYLESISTSDKDYKSLFDIVVKLLNQKNYDAVIKLCNVLKSNNDFKQLSHKAQREKDLAIAAEKNPTIDNYNKEDFEIEGTELKKYKRSNNFFIHMRIVKVPIGVTSIGSGAFANCSSLMVIIIPNSVVSIGSAAFSNCGNLQNVKIPSSVTRIGSSAFSGCSSLESIEIPNSVTKIDESTFQGCNKLTRIEIPDSVNEIGQWSFVNCISLTQITIPSSVKCIGWNAFGNCAQLKSIEIPDGTTSIMGCAFSGCKNLRNIVIHDGITNIEHSIFEGCSNLISIAIPKSIVSICLDAFKGCNNLKNVYIDDLLSWCKIKFIKSGYSSNPFRNAHIFINNIPITKLEIPDGITSIDEDMFQEYNTITSIIIPRSVRSIGAGAFVRCSNLSHVEIPSLVTTIGDRAFYGCDRLKSIEIPSYVNSIGNSAFSNCNNLTSITVSKLNYKYHSLNNCIIETESKKLIVGCNNSVIPDDGSVTIIGYSAFHNCNVLTDVVIPNSITSIEDWAFEGCFNLRSVVIGNSVTSIGRYAFARCPKLTSINIPSSVTSINYDAFLDCKSLTSVIIPDGVTCICDAFSGCSSLTYVEIPSSIKYFDLSVFSRCKNLKSIIYRGTKAQFKKSIEGMIISKIFTIKCIDGIYEY